MAKFELTVRGDTHEELVDNLIGLLHTLNGGGVAERTVVATLPVVQKAESVVQTETVEKAEPVKRVEPEVSDEMRLLNEYPDVAAAILGVYHRNPKATLKAVTAEASNLTGDRNNSYSRRNLQKFTDALFKCGYLYPASTRSPRNLTPKGEQFIKDYGPITPPEIIVPPKTTQTTPLLPETTSDEPEPESEPEVVETEATEQAVEEHNAEVEKIRSMDSRGFTTFMRDFVFEHGEDGKPNRDLVNAMTKWIKDVGAKGIGALTGDQQVALFAHARSLT